MTELELTMRQSECGNLQPQERHQLAEKLVSLAHAEGVEEERKAFMSDVLPHCATCIQAWSMGMKYTIDFSSKENK
jgi:hypothetical protein